MRKPGSIFKSGMRHRHVDPLRRSDALRGCYRTIAEAGEMTCVLIRTSINIRFAKSVTALHSIATHTNLKSS